MHGKEMGLVSIVMPLFNNVDFVGEAIESVLSQTYQAWELIIVDDCSTDGSLEVVKRYMSDKRLVLVEHFENRGVAKARATAIEKSHGRWLAFLDADDLWLPTKLQEHLAFAVEKQAVMSFTAYQTIGESGEYRNTIHVPNTISYSAFLKNTITCSHTALLDLAIVEKSWLTAALADRSFDFPEDLSVWLAVLKRGYDAYGLNEILAKNRKRLGSRSANKLYAVQRTWNQYRKNERLSVLYSAYCLLFQLWNAAKKRRWDRGQ